MNHSALSLPWMTGRTYSSVVGQYSEVRQTLTTLGFHVTCDRDRYANRLKDEISCSKPGSEWTSGSSCGTSANIRLIGCPLSSLRKGSSSGSDTIRLATTRCRVIAGMLLPFLGPN